jgi:hypothetical protein
MNSVGLFKHALVKFATKASFYGACYAGCMHHSCKSSIQIFNNFNYTSKEKGFNYT